MTGHNRKLLTVITEAAIETRLLRDLERLGAHGYTVTDARGKGSRGVRNAGWEASANIRVEVICSDDTAQALAAQGKYVEAEPLYLQALKIYQDVHGENHVDVAATLNNLGVLHRMHGQYTQAEPLLVRALEIKERVHGPDHPDVALSLHNLGQLYIAQGQPEKAEPLYRRALAIREQAFGPTHGEVAKSLEDLVGLLHKLHRGTDAVPYEARLAAFRKPQS